MEVFPPIKILILNKFILMQFEGRKLAELAKPTRLSWIPIQAAY